MKFDVQQRISAGLALLFAAYFVAHTANRASNSSPSQSPPSECLGAQSSDRPPHLEANVTQTAQASGENSVVQQAAPGGINIYRTKMTAEDRNRLARETSEATAEKIQDLAAENQKQRFKEVQCGPNPSIGCPLKIDIFVFPHPHSSGAVLDNIKWAETDSDLRVNLRNPGVLAIQDISLVLRPDVWIIAMEQVTKIADVTVAPVQGPVSAIQIVTRNNDGSQGDMVATPGNLVSSLGVRVLCPKFLPGAEIQFVFACRATNPIDFDNIPKTLFASKRGPPKHIELSGSYLVSEHGVETRYNLRSGIDLPPPP